MPESPLVAEVAAVVRAAAKVRPEVVINAESRLIEDLGIDSLDLVGVSLKIEEHFGLEVDPDTIPNLRRIVDVADYVADRLPASYPAHRGDLEERRRSA
jgi:acyl carrier protein